MKTREILSIVALGLLGVCLLCGLAKMAMKKDSDKKPYEQGCTAFVFIAVVLLGLSQLLNNTTGEGYGTNPTLHQNIEFNKMVEKYSLVPTQNIFVEHSLLWCQKDNDFCHRNWPNEFTHDLKIKQHLLTHSLQLPRNYGIIDCGAHIGDGAIPIADALIQMGRGDIIVYAIDPSPAKCEYIKTIAKINRLANLRVIQCGLSDQDNQVYSHAVDENWLEHNNSGGIRWHNVGEEQSIAQNREKIEFVKLDTLVSKGIIQHPIGYIHFDVENMELPAIRGGLKLFGRDKPILSAETHTEPSKNAILDILQPLGYQFVEKIETNSIFIPTKE
jgi:FkbM family methyltransferase